MSKINLIIKLNKTITVTFYANGGNCSTSSKEVTYNSTYGRLPEATKSGRDFAGWYTAASGGIEITSRHKVGELKNHTLYARWESTVTFDANGGEFNVNGVTSNQLNQQVIEGNRYGTLPVPTRTGYTFAGWYTAQSGGEDITATTIVPDIGNHTLYARWNPATYMVSFNANEGNCDKESQWVTYGSDYGELPTPTRDYYIFKGWFTEVSGGEEITKETTVNRTEDHILYAHWDAEIYKITLDNQGAESAGTTELYYHYKTKTTIDGIGYYYFTDSALTQPITKVNDTKEDGTTNAYHVIEIPKKKGYEFAGYYAEDEKLYFSNKGHSHNSLWSTVRKNITLYAKWNKVEYTVTFDTNATGVSVSPTSKTVTIGNQYGELPTPIRTGYTFDGWYTEASGGNQVTSTTTVNTTQDHTLYAHWTINTYTITYNANEGSGAPDSQTKTYGEDLILSSLAPTREGYTFLGWGTSSSATTASYQPGGTYTANSSATLYAVWQQVISVTSVTLNKTADQWIPLENSSGNAGTLSLTATVSPSNATNKTVTWTSSNTSVATVSNGTVTARGAGLTTVTATAGGKSASVKVYVYNAVLRYRDDWASPVLSAYTYTRNTCSSSYMAGTIYSKSGGTKMVITKSGSHWQILYKTNYNSSGTLGDYIPNGTVTNTGYVTNYGAY